MPASTRSQDLDTLQLNACAAIQDVMDRMRASNRPTTRQRVIWIGDDGRICCRDVKLQMALRELDDVGRVLG